VTHLYLIRHAESTLQYSRHVRDVIEEGGLTPEGVKQVERLRDRLAATREIEAAALLSSNFLRASQTAEIIAPALGLAPQPDAHLQEIRPGDPGDLYWDEYIEKHGFPDPAREPFRGVAPGAENWGQFVLRVAMILHRIAHEYEGDSVVLVCHGGVVDASIIGLFGLGTFFRPSFGLGTRNTSITHWEHSEVSGIPRWTLDRFNDTLHLNYDITRGAGG
jgi:2,3-bisphosphoglycerate-dependent phosphoglycerate mutase